MPVEFNSGDVDKTLSTIREGMKLVVESVAREHVNYLRSYSLDAPAPAPPAKNPFPDRLRRITGNLSNTLRLRSIEGGLTWIIDVIMDYGIYHHGDGTRDVWQKSIDAREGIMQAMAEKRLAEFIRGI